MINRIKIEINGASYIIATPEPEDYVKKLAEELGGQLKQMMDNGPKLSFNDALILCTLNYIDSYKKSEASSDRMRSQLTDYLEDAARARIELDEARREIERLGKRLDMLSHEDNK